MKHKSFASGIALLGSLFVTACEVFAQGSAFTYQGRLMDGANPANGTYNLRFAVYDDVSAGSEQGVTLTNTASVSNGLFTVTLDFGNQFPGGARWLDIGVRTNGNGAFFPLTPRQALTPTPYAITAGTVVSGGLNSGTYGNAVTFNNANNNFSGAFTGNGANVTNVNAASLGGVASSNYWQFGGNNVSAGKFLGSTNNQPVEIWANNQRVMQFGYASNVSDGYSPNVIGGFAGNFVASGVVGATIVGGGSLGNGTNRVLADYGTVPGGVHNTASGIGSVAMGFGNTASGIASTAMGDGSTASGSESTAMGILSVASGSASTAMGSSTASANSSTAMGSSQATHSYATAMGNSMAIEVFSTAMGNSLAQGTNSVAMGNSTATGPYTTASGNSIAASDYGSAFGNSHADGFYATGMGFSAAHGDFSTAMGSSTAGGQWATAAGHNCLASGTSSIAIGDNCAASGDGSVAIGGPCSASGTSSVALGFSTANASYSFAAGREAYSDHPGVFVWADTSGEQFHSTAIDQFLIRAAGGVGIGTAAPETPVHIADFHGITLGTSATGGGYTALRIDLSAATGGYAELQAIGAAGSSFGNLILQANGGRVGIGKNNPATALDVAGTASATVFVTTSDRNLKEHFAPVSSRDVLAKVAAMPITRWNFKEDKSAEHLGPMAQDFKAAFDLGADDKHIATVDEEGVALAAIQGLNEKLDEKETEIERLKAKATQVDLLQQRVEQLERAVRLIAEGKQKAGE